jgi:hypothetical protein
VIDPRGDVFQLRRDDRFVVSGDPRDLFLVVLGEVVVVRSSSPGPCLGAGAVLGGGPVQVAATRDSLLLRVPAHVVDVLVDEAPAAAAVLLLRQRYVERITQVSDGGGEDACAPFGSW